MTVPGGGSGGLPVPAGGGGGSGGGLSVPGLGGGLGGGGCEVAWTRHCREG